MSSELVKIRVRQGEGSGRGVQIRRGRDDRSKDEVTLWTVHRWCPGNVHNKGDIPWETNRPSD